jgi:hypothetical protein
MHLFWLGLGVAVGFAVALCGMAGMLMFFVHQQEKKDKERSLALRQFLFVDHGPQSVCFVSDRWSIPVRVGDCEKFLMRLPSDMLKDLDEWRRFETLTSDVEEERGI